ncbi:hypothetical protein [Corynebacterium mastitidis]|uniref:hypothetical protein n=1 Tax=Corynebacterium mastitidis TaxID=161890 RepID=UPI0012EA5472|nr:hypothetical protein [Corynebacterium mastitidis]
MSDKDFSLDTENMDISTGDSVMNFTTPVAGKYPTSYSVDISSSDVRNDHHCLRDNVYLVGAPAGDGSLGKVVRASVDARRKATMKLIHATDRTFPFTVSFAIIFGLVSGGLHQWASDNDNMLMFIISMGGGLFSLLMFIILALRAVFVLSRKYWYMSIVHHRDPSRLAPREVGGVVVDPLLDVHEGDERARANVVHLSLFDGAGRVVDDVAATAKFAGRVAQRLGVSLMDEGEGFVVSWDDFCGLYGASVREGRPVALGVRANFEGFAPSVDVLVCGTGSRDLRGLSQLVVPDVADLVPEGMVVKDFYAYTPGPFVA